ncbi:hypothetical protein OGAPHI_000710 [Ogataea philodendri]|uniref:CS domain-containing protein n=1 Tax=Ogataea philodendri TaxID=1378263 RepID=A0A9P8T9W7_9ASCO|nr:uncharacterized protein OGAPHI_000710 [Ogataea philodendri]KAH3670999.1 hypothetical protein OGAPHI_000710 [Ogataea philodendri]
MHAFRILLHDFQHLERFRNCVEGEGGVRVLEQVEDGVDDWFGDDGHERVEVGQYDVRDKHEQDVGDFWELGRFRECWISTDFLAGVSDGRASRQGTMASMSMGATPLRITMLGFSDGVCNMDLSTSMAAHFTNMSWSSKKCSRNGRIKCHQLSRSAESNLLTMNDKVPILPMYLVLTSSLKSMNGVLTSGVSVLNSSDNRIPFLCAVGDIFEDGRLLLLNSLSIGTRISISLKISSLDGFTNSKMSFKIRTLSQHDHGLPMDSSLKRVFSHSQSPSSRPSKIKKLTDSIFSIFHRNDTDLTNDTSLIAKSRPNTSLNTDSFRSQSSPVTARQLKEYYESIKRENSVLYSKLKDEDDTHKAESTNLADESTLTVPSRVSSASVPSKRKISTSSVLPSKQIKKPAPSFSIDPIERAQLVVLKKRMQTDRYRKSRMTYLRDHTRNLVHTSSNLSANPKYIDTSVETIEQLPQPSAQTALKLVPGNIPKERLNQNGIFKAVLDYDDEEPEPQPEKKIDTKPLTEKIKFSSKTDSQPFASSGLGSSFDTAAKPKFVAEKKVEKPLESAPVKPTPAFTFTDKKDTETKPVDKPTEEKKEAPKFAFGSTTEAPKFSFGSTAEPPKFSLSTPEPPKLSLANGNQKDEETEPKRKKFTFGDKSEETPKPSFSFSSAPAQPKSSFSFGAKPEEPKKEPAAASVAAPAPSFSFGNKPAEPAEPAEPSKPQESMFSFGAKPAEEPKTETPKFTFSSSLGRPAEAAKPANGFGSSSFTFGAKPEEKAEPAAAFSFGQSTKSETPPTSSEPSTTVEPPKSNDSAKSAPFASGSSAPAKEPEAKPFSFGAAGNDAKPAETKPFSFGSAPKQDQKPAETKPFSFGAAKPEFSFGSKPAEPAAAPAFGASTNSAFGAPASTPSSSASGFSFGEASKPANQFTFGGSTAGKDTAAAAAPAPAFSFGSNNGFAFGKPQGGAPTSGSSGSGGFGFSGGSLTNPAAGQSVFGNNTPQQGNKIFNFQGQPAAQTPTGFSGFNPSRSATPNFDFTGAPSASNVDPSSTDADKNLLYLTINITDPEKPQIELTPTSLKFEAVSGGQKYKLDLEFYEEVDDKRSKYEITGSHVFFVLYKKTLGQEYWPRLTKLKLKYHFIKTDFDKWADEDEQDELQDDDLNKSLGDLNSFGDDPIDFAKLAAQNGGQFPSFDPDSINEASSSDDEDQEEK